MTKMASRANGQAIQFMSFLQELFVASTVQQGVLVMSIYTVSTGNKLDQVQFIADGEFMQ